MHTLRTRFGNDIVAEFLPPKRSVKKVRVVIIASGVPSVPAKNYLLEFLSKKGFWAIHFRYRGSWESNGKFLAQSPHLDIKEIIDHLPRGFRDSWNNKTYKIKADQIIILGSSFGGAAAILASTDPRVDKAISISPGIDWSKPGPDEPYPKLIKFFVEAFGQGYRLAPKGWQKLRSGKFFSPIAEASRIDGSKNLIIHAKDDRTCPYAHAKKFADITGAKLITLRKGDHLSSSIIMAPKYFKIFQKFIKS
jgi:pimeloyl-ACP methyl ester carboxylesterase